MAAAAGDDDNDGWGGRRLRKRTDKPLYYIPDNSDDDDENEAAAGSRRLRPRRKKRRIMNDDSEDDFVVPPPTGNVLHPALNWGATAPRTNPHLNNIVMQLPVPPPPEPVEDIVNNVNVLQQQIPPPAAHPFDLNEMPVPQPEEFGNPVDELALACEALVDLKNGPGPPPPDLID